MELVTLSITGSEGYTEENLNCDKHNADITNLELEELNTKRRTPLKWGHKNCPYKNKKKCP
jgi:hypothetical protein